MIDTRLRDLVRIAQYMYLVRHAHIMRQFDKRLFKLFHSWPAESQLGSDYSSVNLVSASGVTKLSRHHVQLPDGCILSSREKTLALL